MHRLSVNCMSGKWDMSEVRWTKRASVVGACEGCVHWATLGYENPTLCKPRLRLLWLVTIIYYTKPKVFKHWTEFWCSALLFAERNPVKSYLCVMYHNTQFLRTWHRGWHLYPCIRLPQFLPSFYIKTGTSQKNHPPKLPVRGSARWKEI